MCLGMAEALEEISLKVNELLGPLADFNNLTVDSLLSFATDFGIQLCATIILFLVVRFFLWKPITNMLEKRREAIDKELEDARIAKENAIQIEANLQKEMENAKSKVRELIEKAERDANLRRESIINDAKEEARRRLDNLEIELVQEKKKMEKEIKQEIVDIAFATAEKIVAKEIDHDKYIDVVDEILKGANE